MKMETLQQRRDELDRKEQELKESLLKFDKFLKVIYSMQSQMCNINGGSSIYVVIIVLMTSGSLSIDI